MDMGRRLPLLCVAAVMSIAVAGCSMFGSREHGTSAAIPAPSPADTAAADTANSVFFTPGKTELSADARRQIEGWAQALRSQPNTRFTIVGHGDEHATRDYAIALGAERAQAVKDYLVSLGVAEQRLVTTSYGKESPAATAPTAEAQALDSRAVIMSESVAAVPQ